MEHHKCSVVCIGTSIISTRRDIVYIIAIIFILLLQSKSTHVIWARVLKYLFLSLHRFTYKPRDTVAVVTVQYQESIGTVCVVCGVSYTLELFIEWALITVMTEKPSKRSRSKTNTPEKGKDQCVTCKKMVSTDDDATECQWCEKWQHKVCAKIIY